MADDFFTKQLPHNVTWGLTVLYALDASKDLSDLAAQVGPGKLEAPTYSLFRALVSVA